MSKVTVEFDLPEEQEEYNIFTKARELYSTLFELQNNILRNKLKYEKLNNEFRKGVEWSREQIYSQCEINGIDHLF